MKFIDIGANLSNTQFKGDLDLVLNNAFKTKVEQIILTTVDTSSFIKNIELCNQQHSVELYTTWGVHPHNAKYLEDFIKSTNQVFTEESNKIKALGEFGLDFFRMISTKEEQEYAMHYFMNFAKKVNLPLFLHERGAHDSFLSIIKEHSVPNKSVVHCFTGNKQEVKSYLDLGMYIGITGWVCDERRNKELVEALQYIPNDLLMLETDSPYLKPRTIQKKSIRNEPAFIMPILEKICEIKKVNIEFLSETIYNNTVEFFKLNSLEKKLKL